MAMEGEETAEYDVYLALTVCSSALGNRLSIGNYLNFSLATVESTLKVAQ
jgi:hypothetical protein